MTPEGPVRLSADEERRLSAVGAFPRQHYIGAVDADDPLDDILVDLGVKLPSKEDAFPPPMALVGLQGARAIPSQRCSKRTPSSPLPVSLFSLSSSRSFLLCLLLFACCLNHPSALHPMLTIEEG